MTINWPNNSRKKRAVIKGGQSQGELSGRALQGSAKGLVLFNIFITNLKGRGDCIKMKSADGYSLQRICRPQEEQG